MSSLAAINTPSEDRPPTRPTLLVASLVAIGFASTIAQIVLMRELVATFYGNELLFGLILAAWLVWGAVGAWSLGTRLCRRMVTHRHLAIGLLLAPLALIGEIILIRDIRGLLGIIPGAFVEFAPMLGAIALVLAPFCLLAGYLFSLGARLIVETGRPAGQAYALESLGAVLGGTLFSLLLIHWLDPFQTALCIAAVCIAVVVPFYTASKIRARSTMVLCLATAILLTIAGLRLGAFLQENTVRWQWPDLVFVADSPYGRIAVQARNGQRIFYENGLLAFETQSVLPEETVHFPMLAHPDPRHALLIGGGLAGGLLEILKHPVQSVTYVEIDPLFIAAAREYLPAEQAAVLEDSRLDLAVTDARQYVNQTSGQEKPLQFDVIIVDLPEPATGALNRFYTLEFFQAIRRLLDGEGIFSLGLPSAENYLSPELARRNASVYQTLRQVFPSVVVLPGERNLFLASAKPILTDPVAVAARLTSRAIDSRWVTAAYIEYTFTTDRLASLRATLGAQEGVRINQDFTPISYYYDLALWLSRFYPNLRQLFESAGLLNLAWIAAGAALWLVIIRWRRSRAVASAMAAIGFSQMVLQLVILFAFQVTHGSLYSEVSLIITAFMAGMALGSGFIVHITRLYSYRPTRRTFIAVQAATTVYSSALPLLFLLPTTIPKPAFALLALAAGALTGTAFPLAARLAPGDPGRAAGSLYAADLLGGCAGALLTTALLIPVLGIPQTCFAVAIVAFAGLLGQWP